MMVTSPGPTTARFRGSSKLWQGIELACLLCMEARQVHGGRHRGRNTPRHHTPEGAVGQHPVRRGPTPVSYSTMPVFGLRFQDHGVHKAVPLLGVEVDAQVCCVCRACVCSGGGGLKVSVLLWAPRSVGEDARWT
jgi:hypothetical protein